MKISISLIETLFSIVILGVILVSSSSIILSLNKKNIEEYQKISIKLDFESTRLFLNTKVNQLSKLSYSNNKLYYDNHLLLNNVSLYSKVVEYNITTIDLCIKNSGIKDCQILKFR